MNDLKFYVHKIDVQAVHDVVVSPSSGAVSLFVGTTRDNFEGKTVLSLEYEAYETMGIKAMEKICEEIREQWPEVEKIAIHHRLGLVPITEASIVIAISSPHRVAAIKATEYCITRVKEVVPIWKKEIYENSPPAWKENEESSNLQQEIEITPIPSHQVQIRASSDEIEKRIQKFMERKREEINKANIRDFCRSNPEATEENSCARVNSVLVKRKDSKGHLQVNKVYNNYSRDQNCQNYLMKFIPKDGLEERILNMETQLSMHKAAPKDIYKRLKVIEDRLLQLESISPEYLQFWDKLSVHKKRVRKRKTFCIGEIDDFIKQLEKRRCEE